MTVSHSPVCMQYHLCDSNNGDEDSGNNADDDWLERTVRESSELLPGESTGPALGYSDLPPIPNLGPAGFLTDCHKGLVERVAVDEAYELMCCAPVEGGCAPHTLLSLTKASVEEVSEVIASACCSCSRCFLPAGEAGCSFHTYTAWSAAGAACGRVGVCCQHAGCSRGGRGVGCEGRGDGVMWYLPLVVPLVCLRSLAEVPLEVPA